MRILILRQIHILHYFTFMKVTISTLAILWVMTGLVRKVAGGDIINHETSLNKMFQLNEMGVNLVSNDDVNLSSLTPNTLIVTFLVSSLLFLTS
jgi:hypothetical protein